jgi:hypothetical protein
VNGASERSACSISTWLPHSATAPPPNSAAQRDAPSRRRVRKNKQAVASPSRCWSITVPLIPSSCVTRKSAA